MVQGVGIEPTKFGEKARDSRIFGVWRYRRYSFFAVSFPFLFLITDFSDQFQNLPRRRDFEDLQ